MQGDTIPKFIEDAARAGAGEGSRNDRAFWLAAQCRDSRISKGSAEGLMDLFCRSCNPPLGDREAAQALNSAYRSAPREPPMSKDGGKKKAQRTPRADADEIIPWDGEIGKRDLKKEGVGAVDYSMPVPEPSGDPVADLRAWLVALYKPDDKVNYVVQAFKGDDGKWKPMGNGVTRSRTDIETDLAKYEAKGHKGEAVLRYVLGDWTPEAGVWARINPMDGKGVTNHNVVRMDHVLVEGDEQEIGKQLAIIKSCRLPCAAIVHSGAKSVHAIVNLDSGGDKAVYAERTEILFKALGEAGFTVDVKCKNSSRLSRLPGPSRNGKPQYMVSGPCGAESFNEWLGEREESDFQAEILTDEDLNETPEPDSLLGDRFLCREGSWLFIAQSGVGKSVFAVQAAVSICVGRDVFGLKCVAPMRVVIVQAENNRGDQHETFTGVCRGLRLDNIERDLLHRNFRSVRCSRYTGHKFASFVAHLCRQLQPQIVIVDPLLSYIGGEISRMEDCSRFLQNQLQPVIEDAKVGLIVMHHTPKPPKDEDGKYKGADLAYLGIGSSVLTNWARATSTLLRMPDCDNRFVLQHSKRSDRCGCNPRAEIMHATGGEIFWLPAPGKVPDAPKYERGGPTGQRGRPAGSKYDGMGFEQMPPLAGDYDPEKSPVVRWVSDTLARNGFPEKPTTCKNLLKNLTQMGFIKFNSDSRLWVGTLYDGGLS